VYETEDFASKAKILKETPNAICFDIVFDKVQNNDEEVKSISHKSVSYIGNVKTRNQLKETEKVSARSIIIYYRASFTMMLLFDVENM